MSARWITAAIGIRYREHPERKHGKRPDRYFAIRHRVDGRRVEEALGWASEGWTVEKASNELSKLKEATRTGQGDPTLRAKREKADAGRKAEARRARLEKTVSDLWGRYLKEVAAVANKPRTLAEKARMWETRIKPAIGHIMVNEVTEEDAGAIVRAPLKTDAKGVITGGKAEAANLYRLQHHLFRKALGWGLRSKELGNPLENVNEPKVPRRERLFTAGEIGALLNALDAKRKDGTCHNQVAAAIKAAILSGARISELLTLRWTDIRRDEMEIHLPDTKSGFSRRPLSTELLALFDTVKKMPGVPFVFRGIEDPRTFLSYNTVEKAFHDIAKAAKVEGCSLHTIRHWFATMTANSVNNPRVGMALTGHKSHAAYMNYLHSDKEQARALADQLAALATRSAEKPENVATLADKRQANGT